MTAPSRSNQDRPGHPGLHVHADRLLQRIVDLGEVGDTGDGGCSRLALTDADREGRDLVVGWMRDLGLVVTVDGIGNVVGQMPHLDPTAPVMTGSHIDTVATGGRYDGNLGVLAGLEVIETVIRAGVCLERPLAVGFFTGEEGARFAPDMLGSLAYVGGLDIESAYQITDASGVTVREELERVGYRGAAPIPGPTPYAFVELHIEQGPVLEQRGATIGVVSGVQGISWSEITIQGQSNHAGTTPMSLRRDPVAAGARLTTFVRDLALHHGDPQVATVGSFRVRPDLVNVVAVEATLTVDLRNTDEAILVGCERALEHERSAVEREFGVITSIRQLARFEPVDFDPAMTALIAEVALERGVEPMQLPSGAGHDAQMMARICPTGMIFVPSRNGVSHNPAEHTDACDIELGANVLLDTMLRLATEKARP